MASKQQRPTRKQLLRNVERAHKEVCLSVVGSSDVCVRRRYVLWSVARDARFRVEARGLSVSLSAAERRVSLPCNRRWSQRLHKLGAIVQFVASSDQRLLGICAGREALVQQLCSNSWTSSETRHSLGFTCNISASLNEPPASSRTRAFGTVTAGTLTPYVLVDEQRRVSMRLACELTVSWSA